MIQRLIAKALTVLQERYRQPDEPPSSDDIAGHDLPRTYTINDYIDGSPYLTRTVFPRMFGIRPLLHRFHRPDGDRALHNHPWEWCLSIILTGQYVELRLDRGCDAEQIRTVRRFNVIRHGDYHSISQLRGEVFTLFLTGRRVSDWGFLGEFGEHVPHQEYKAAQIARKERERLG